MSRFIVTPQNGRSYSVYGNENTPLEIVFLSQKCWFQTGDKVVVSDENNNRQEFTVYSPEFITENNVEINCGAKSCLKCHKCYKANGYEYVSEKLK